MRSWIRRTTDSRSQILPTSALVMIVLIGAIGLAIDAGRCFIARAELVRAVDAAALAATLELPNLTNAQNTAVTYMAQNEPLATPQAVASPSERQVQVTGTKTVKLVFMRIFGINSVNVSASATAGYGVLAVDTVLVMDDTGSMNPSNCDVYNPSTCPITQSRIAAKSFVDVLLADTIGAQATKVGLAPFRGCYNATTNINPLNESGSGKPNWQLRGCAKLTDTKALSNDKTAIDASIDLLKGPGGFPGTNLCLGLARGWKILSGTGTQAHDRKVLVILTDGDNSFTDGAQANVAASDPPSLPTTTPHRYLANPAPKTYPTSITDSNGAPASDSDTVIDSCWADYPVATNQDATPPPGNDYDKRVNSLDSHTLQQADNLKAQNVEIFVVGFGVVGTDTGAKCDRSLVGNGSGRTGSSDTRDRNLAKCLASSTTNTNDHYFEAGAASQLPAVFAQIARLVGFRLIK